jgi:hypothetical protein
MKDRGSIGYNGMKAGPSYHQRYFQLKGYDKAKKAEVIKKRRGAYTAYVFPRFS